MWAYRGKSAVSPEPPEIWWQQAKPLLPLTSFICRLAWIDLTIPILQIPLLGDGLISRALIRQIHLYDGANLE